MAISLNPNPLTNQNEKTRIMKEIKLKDNDELRLKQLADALETKRQLEELLKNRAEIKKSKINQKLEK